MTGRRPTTDHDETAGYTAVRERPRDERPQRAQRAQRPEGRRSAQTAGTRRTFVALAASALAIFPLRALFNDGGWMIDVWLTMLVVVGPAAFIRRYRRPGALDIWPGVVLMVPWLTLRFLSDTAVLGLIPTGRTWDQLSLLMDDLHETTRQEVAPIHTTVAVRLVLCALVGLLAALVDLIAVVGRRGALAGIPLLVVYTVAGAVPRTPVSWVWFVIAAVAYLLLLALDADDDLKHWGRRVRTTGEPRRARTALSVAAPRIAAAAVAAAVVLPLLMPSDSRNLLADAFHGGDGDGVGGFGGGGGGSISPFAVLRGQLDRDDPVKLAEVRMNSGGGDEPYYLRVNVLSQYTDKGWQVASHGDTVGIDNTQYPTEPQSVSPDTVNLEARIKVTRMRGNPAVFDRPTSISGLDSDTTWSAQDQLLLGSSLSEGDEYTEQFSQPSPSVAQLRDASDRIDESVRSQLDVPDDFPAYARDLVRKTIAGQTSQYGKARAISDFFADDKNGFIYDFATEPGDSDSDLVNFLKNRRGFCQQFAAAMAIMLREAGVPARVVLGYTHDGANAQGDFSISTNNAHAWVEAWFAGIGWVPFDPTPAGGAGTGGRDTLKWAPKSSDDTTPSTSTSSSASSSASTSQQGPVTSSSSGRENTAAQDDGGADLDTVWLGGGILVVVLGLALAPSTARWSRRRRRFAAARRDGDPDGLWDELSDTATDLGYVWSPARSPRQVASWLEKDAAGAAGSLRTLADAVERRRYSPARPGAQDSDRLVEGVQQVSEALRAHRSGRTRFRARFLPASLGGWAALFNRGRHRD